MFGTGKLRKRGFGIQYTRGESHLHRLHPLTKLLALVMITAASLIFVMPLPLMILTGILIALAIVSRLGGAIGRAYLLITPLLIFVILLDAFFSGIPTGQVYYSASFGWVHPELTSSRLVFATAMGFRLLVISTASVLFILTTEYNVFVRSLRSIKIPEHISFSLTYALRSITGLTEDAGRIMDAQRSRGMEFDRTIVGRNRNRLMAVTIPMTVAMLHRARHVSDAMQSRGFGGGMTVSNYNAPHFGSIDVIALLSLVAGLFLIGIVSIS